MRKLLLTICICTLLFATAGAQNYIMISWNDLGMHCANRDFARVVVLPPYNNVHAQVIRLGDAVTLPMVVTENIHVTYEIPGNTYSVGKTNFWDYDSLIFGVNLAPNIGLTGNGMTGTMIADFDNFVATGIPITPFTDADLINEDPFQLGMLRAYDQSNNLIATSTPVIPVSNEINCVSSGCHPSELDILNEHDLVGGFNPANTPILCASCHSSNALGTPGIPEANSFSQTMHESHGGRTNDCYKCHPGPNTQCLRDVMSQQHGMTCQSCHGSVLEVGTSIDQGREPWLEEPSCGDISCHGPQFAEQPGMLFRMSRGHGGLFCSACHGEPHAIVPSREARDNQMNINLQGHAGTLNTCSVCHGVTPTGAGPHGMYAGACAYVPGDIGGNGQANGIDVVYGVSYLKGGNPPATDCHPPCTDQPDPFYAAADVNGNCAFNGIDITFFVAYLKGIQPALLYCANCPPTGMGMR